MSLYTTCAGGVFPPYKQTDECTCSAVS